jgi:ABC-type dipeptide/oligopeptide/nickel transport system permease subunit
MARRDPWLFVGLIGFFGLLLLALFGERLAPHESIYFVPVHGDDPRPYDPGLVFPFGSDVLGRDLFSLVLAGAGTTLTVVLLAGASRVLAGVLVAVVASVWRPSRLLIESSAVLASAVPATLVALVLVKILVTTGDASIGLFIGALLLTGWAGPYRVIRAELDRLALMPFTQGAQAVGVRPSRLLWRHHVPHLVPVVAVNLSQQVVASLVLVAELGVLGVFVGTTLFIDIAESLPGLAGLRSGAVSAAQISDPPEWGSLLASARTIESLWTTRWLVFVPGVAFGVTAVALAAIGFAFSRRYARRDLSDDLHGRGMAALAVAVAALFVVSALVPERYAAAREWASAARAEGRRAPAEVGDAFRAAGLRPIGTSYAIERDVSRVVQTGAATATVGGVTITEPWPQTREPLAAAKMRSFVSASTGGGVVEAPLVFAARGISPADYPPGPAMSGYARAFFGVDLGTQIKDYADDYAAIDVRGKVVLLVRFMGIAARVPNVNGNDYTAGPSGDVAIARAITRGAAAVIYVDVGLDYEMRSGRGNVDPTSMGPPTGVQGLGTYLETERIFPVTRTSGVPVVVVSSAVANQLLAPLGLDVTPLLGWDVFGDSVNHRTSGARDLGVTARVEVPLERQRAAVTSLVAEVDGLGADTGRIVVWAVRKPTATNPAGTLLAALSRSLGTREVPFVFVDFDPSVDPVANAKAIREALGDRRIALVLVLDFLDGTALQFTTPYGDLIPAMNLYAEKADARFEPTRLTARVSALDEIAPFLDVKTVLVSGNGRFGDVRPDAAALVGYIAGRHALGAEELPR